MLETGMNDTGSKKTVDLNAYRDALVTEMVKSYFHLIRVEEQERGIEFSQTVMMNFLSSVIATLVFESLTNPPDVSDSKSSSVPPDDKTRRYEIARDSFRALKAQLKSAVATGFTGGFLNFDPERGPVEYLVDIYPMPEAINRLPV